MPRFVMALKAGDIVPLYDDDGRFIATFILL